MLTGWHKALIQGLFLWLSDTILRNWFYMFHKHQKKHGSMRVFSEQKILLCEPDGLGSIPGSSIGERETTPDIHSAVIHVHTFKQACTHHTPKHTHSLINTSPGSTSFRIITLIRKKGLYMHAWVYRCALHISFTFQ